MFENGWWLVLGLALAAALIAALMAWRPLRGILQEIQLERARELFALQRERLEAKFLDMATATGKPRGLRWKDCDFASEVQFARDRGSGQLTALVGATIEFEAIAGSDMEGLPAVSNLRNATAVFFFQGGHWHTAGRALFNMNPDEALDHFKGQYDRVEMG
jgi:hypothetical protein